MTIEEGGQPEVTVVMPAHNSAQTLRDSAQSVLDQTVRSLELIIIDDGSTDDTSAIAEALARTDARVRLIRRAVSGGPAVARNAGIEVARGRYLAFCDADDLWLATKLERQLEVARNTGAALVYSAYYRIDADFSGTAADFGPTDRVVRVRTRLSYSELLRSNVVGCLTAVVDTEQTAELSMPDIPGAEDWALWLRILRQGGIAVGVDEPLALYRAARQGSHSSRRWSAVRAIWRVLRREEKLPVWLACRYLISDAAAALRKSRI